jgi:predicted HicB family RNase H-like nuclease
MVLESDKYTYRVLWSEEDEEFIGLCAEFPSLSWLALTSEKALKGIRSVVKDCVSDMNKNKEEIPLPLTTRKYSGKFMVRVPPEVHRHLAIEAAESGVSLNRIASAKLAVRFSQPPVSSVASEAERVESCEQSRRSVHRESCRP